MKVILLCLVVKISGNTASYPEEWGMHGDGGGIYSSGSFIMSGGQVSDNTAKSTGGGVYVGSRNVDGVFKLSGGKISDNTAWFGGGIWVDVEQFEKLFVSDGVVFSNNRASAAYNRNPVHDNVYNSHIGHKVTWSFSFTQGYNNYDISYISVSHNC